MSERTSSSARNTLLKHKMEIIVNIIAIFVIILTVGGAALYIIRAKRRGDKCVGCPYAKQCGGNCGGSDAHAKTDEKGSSK